MDLDGQVLPGVDELCQQREFPHIRAVFAPERLPVQSRQIVQRPARQRAALHHGHTLRPLGQLPALRRDLRRVLLVIGRPQAVSAPEVLLVRRMQLQRREFHIFPFPFHCYVTRMIARRRGRGKRVFCCFPPENAANAVHDEEVSFPPPLRTASAGAQGPPISLLPPERRGGHAVSCRKYLFFPLAFPWDVCYDRGKSQHFIPRKELFPCWIFSTFWAP